MPHDGSCHHCGRASDVERDGAQLVRLRRLSDDRSVGAWLCQRCRGPDRAALWGRHYVLVDVVYPRLAPADWHATRR